MTKRVPPAPSDLDVAISHHQAGRLDKAEAIYRRILKMAPNDLDALHLLGLVSLEKGEASGAVTFIENAIALNPAIAEFHNSLGNALKAMGDFDRACTSFRRALELDPTLDSVHVNLGNALLAQDNLEEAEQEYRGVLAKNPRNFEALTNLGNLLKERDAPNLAEDMFRQAIAVNPRSAEVTSNLGYVLLSQKRYDDAVECFERAIALNPDYAKSYSGIGNTLIAQRKWIDAELALKKAIELDPEDPSSHINMSSVHFRFRRLDDALSCLERALRIDPDNETALTFRALGFLTYAKFAEGWKGYLQRDSMRDQAHELHRQPLPKTLKDKKIFLRREQGLGDEIFFLRFAPELIKRGANITYQAGAKIASIVRRLPFLEVVPETTTTQQGMDIVLSIGDLPYLLGMTSIEDIPPTLTMSVGQNFKQQMEVRLKAIGHPPYVGITWWAGTPGTPGLIYKLAPLDQIAAVLRPVNGTLIALQRRPKAGDIEALSAAVGRPVHDFSSLNDDLEAMLALLSLIDGYVTVSNTNVHLRAGVGKTSHVLVPNPPEWRWMAEGDESPWFPGTRVYRQGYDQSWDEAFSRLSDNLLEDLGRA